MLTGATGFIGSHIAEKLLRKQVPTHLFIRRRTDATDRFERNGAELFTGKGPNDIEMLKSSLENVNTVIHCAAATKAINRAEFLKANVDFTENILKLLQNDQRLIFISSQAVAGPSPVDHPTDENALPRPITHYGESKLLAEQAIKRWGLEKNGRFVILRPCSVYGPRERDFYVYFKLINRNLFVIPGNDGQRISIVHVKDLVAAILTAAESANDGETYFICNNKATSWLEIANTIKTVLGKKRLLKFKFPEWITYSAVLLSDTIHRVKQKPGLISRQKLLEANQPAWVCSNRKIKKELGWSPEISLEQGIRETAEWYRKHGWI